jgi:hypothetical protein
VAGAGLVRLAMKRCGMVQEDFARDVLWVSPRTLTRILKGERALKPREAARVREARTLAYPRNGRPRA